MHILPSYENAFKDESYFQVIKGTAGSGKSQYAAYKTLTRCLTQRGLNQLCLRKVQTTLRDSVFKELKLCIARENWEPAFEIKENEMRFKCIANGNEIILKGCDDVGKFKSIVGVGAVWFEEAIDFTQEDVMQFVYRMRGRRKWYKQMILTFNPTKATSWIKTDFFDNRPQDALVLETSYTDNPYITQQDRYDFEVTARKDPKQYKIFTLGQWADLAGGNPFYYNFNVQKHISNEALQPKAELPLHVSYDFNRHPYLTLLVFQIIDGAFTQVDEICLKHPKSNTIDATLAFKEKYFDMLQSRAGVFIYGDPAGRHTDTRSTNDYNDYNIIRDILKEYSPTMRVLRSAPVLKARYYFINRALNEYYPEIRILINKTCLNTIEDFSCIQQAITGEKHKEKETLENGLVCERLGHCSDAFDYCLLSVYSSIYENFIKPHKPFRPIYRKNYMREYHIKKYGNW